MRKCKHALFNDIKHDNSVIDTNKDIVIYPSSWYYNACVHGFLEVLARGLGEDGDRIIVEQILQDDGKAVISSDLAQAIFSTDGIAMPNGYNEQPIPTELKKMKRIAWWWTVTGYEADFMKKDDRGKSLSGAEMVETVCRSLFHKTAPYSNLAQLSWDKVDFLNTWFTLDHHTGPNNVFCSFCGQEYVPDPEARVYDAFFTRSLSLALGDGPGVFPNRFWDSNPNLTTCKRCRSYFICFHIVQRNRFFINSDSLQVNWYLNRMLAGKLRQNRFAYQVALLDALQYDPQLRKGITAWGLQNLEVLVFERNMVRYYPLSPRLAKMFLVPQISSYISKIRNQEVWDIILKEQFNYLLTIIYKSLRAYLTKNNLGDDPEVIYNPSSIRPVFDLIALSAEIFRFLSAEKGGKRMGYINTGQLRELGATAPLAQNDSMVFRLLELTRLNQKADVYHLLLRVYVARNIEFPKPLARIFSLDSPELFKIGIYAYISGFRPGEKAETEN